VNQEQAALSHVENYSSVVFFASMYRSTSEHFKGETNFSSLEERSGGSRGNTKTQYADELRELCANLDVLTCHLGTRRQTLSPYMLEYNSMDF